PCREFWYIFSGTRNRTLTNETIADFYPNRTLAIGQYLVEEVTESNVNVTYNPCGVYPEEIRQKVISPKTNGTSNLPPDFFVSSSSIITTESDFMFDTATEDAANARPTIRTGTFFN
ncbi:unnamed protein product, partial [Amoebophrya sp. A120]